jgi:hypothetical protein
VAALDWRGLLNSSIGEGKASQSRRGAEQGPAVLGRHTLVDELERGNFVRQRITIGY